MIKRWLVLILLSTISVSGETVPQAASFKGFVGAEKPGIDRLVAIRRNSISPSHIYTYHTEGFKAGSELLVCTLKNGSIKMQPIFASDTGLIMDAALSRDAKTILFSFKEQEDGFFHVYEIGVDGTGLKQITHGDSNNFNACWLLANSKL